MKLICALFVMLICIMPLEAATSTSFSADQTQQIQKIIHDYLLQNPEVIVEVVEKLKQKQQQTLQSNAPKTIQDNAALIFKAPQSPVLGNKNASINLVEFFDYQCTHCKNVASILAKLMNNNPQLRIVLKELPVLSSSEYAARAALASQIQNKFAEMNEALLKAGNPLSNEKVLQIARSVGLNVEQLQKDMENQSIKDEITQNMHLAAALGLVGTPAFIIASVKGEQVKNLSFIPGMTTETILQNSINKAKA